MVAIQPNLVLESCQAQHGGNFLLECFLFRLDLHPGHETSQRVSLVHINYLGEKTITVRVKLNLRLDDVF